MDVQTVTDLCFRGLQLVIVLSLPAVIVSSGVGFFIALIETITSIQDQSIAGGAKIIAVFLTVMLTAHWSDNAILNYANTLFDAIANVGVRYHG
jgi:type III secretion protein S